MNACLFQGRVSERMDSRHDKKRMIVEDDRLSSLPDDLIHKILSFIGVKNAIKTSALSSRWRFIWTSMPYLDFSSEHFHTLPKFSNYVTHVLSLRNNQVEVFSIKLRFRGDFSQEFVKQIMNYAFCHNIQQLDVVCLLGNNIELPLSLFSSQSLKHLSLESELISYISYPYSLTATSTWELPALTTLYLHHVTLCCNDNIDTCIDLFSKCANLKNLTLKRCNMKGSNRLSICHPRLSNLTLDDDHRSWEVFNVVAPQLKNLTISNLSWGHYMISAPELASLLYDGYYPLHLSTDGFNSLGKLGLSVYSLNDADPPRIVHLFQQLRSVKILTLNMEIVELLSSCVELISNQPSPFANLKSLKILPIFYTWFSFVNFFVQLLSSCVELISNQPSPFANLKSLKIYPIRELSKEQEKKVVKMSTEVKSYLLDNSPNATFTMVTREEFRAMKNTKLVQKLMTGLRALLEREKTKMETDRAHMERRKSAIEIDKRKMHGDDQWNAQAENLLLIEERMTHINMCWKDLTVQIERGKEKACDILSRLHAIKQVLIKLPTANKAELQPCFSSLCAEADALVNNIIGHMKIQCDVRGYHFSDYFHELASTSHSSS